MQPLRSGGDFAQPLVWLCAHWPSPQHHCVQLRWETCGVAGTRDAEPGEPSATCLGCRKDKNAAVWARSRQVLKGESLSLQPQCLPQPWEHALEGLCCEPAAVSLARR